MYKKIADLLKESKKTTVLTGNGISIDPHMINDKYKVDSKKYNDVNLINLCNKDLNKSDRDFISYYRKISRQIELNKPSKIHEIINEWQDRKIIDLIITQNIDGYHGIKNVIELYGNINKFYCLECNKAFNGEYYQLSHKCDNKNDYTKSEYTKCNGTLRPDIVLVGENPKNLELALFNMYKSDIILLLGTDMNTSPVNKLPIIAKEIGAKLIAINKSPIESISKHIDYFIYGEEIIDVLEKINKLIV